MKKPVVLRIYKGDQLISVKQFTSEQVVIGSQADVQLPLEDAKVSAIHAAIEERDSGYYLFDLGSEGGTIFHGEPILDAKLEAGDFFEVGPFRIEFFVGVPKPKAAPVSDVTRVTTITPATDPEKPTVTAPQPTEVAKPIEPTPTVPIAPVTIAPVTEEPLQHIELMKPPAEPDKPKAAPSKTEVIPPRKAPVEPSANVASGSTLMANTNGAPEVELHTPPVMGVSLGAPSRVKTPVRKKPHGKSKGTFAPASKYGNIRDYVKPTKGTVVEVLVAWKERIIATYHFSGNRAVTLGAHPDNDIVLPVLGSKVRKMTLLRLEGRAIVNVTPEMTGELIRGQQSSSFAELLRQNRMTKNGPGYALTLDQGEMLSLDFADNVSVVIRYVSDSPKPLVAPLFDLTSAEFMGVVLSIAVSAVLALYTFLYTPPTPLADENAQEPLRTAFILVKPPTPPAEPKEPPPPPPPRATPTPKPVTKATPSPKKEDKHQNTARAQDVTPKKNPGAASNIAPKDKKSPKQLSSVKQGGAVKTSNTQGAQMQAPKKDVTKTGLFSVFGGGGKQTELSQNYSGAGELSGMANAASGKAGMNENRPGAGLGSALKDTGRGGTGTSLVGVPDVKTHGRGGGESGVGDSGLGNRKGTKIVSVGVAENFHGSIDPEAIRRVIMSQLRVIRTCYERELNRNPDLFGKLVLEWTIGEQGRILSVGTKSSELGNTNVAECVMSRLKTWKFPEPPPNEQVTVAYPFFFSN